MLDDAARRKLPPLTYTPLVYPTTLASETRKPAPFVEQTGMFTPSSTTSPFVTVTAIVVRPPPAHSYCSSTFDPVHDIPDGL